MHVYTQNGDLLLDITIFYIVSSESGGNKVSIKNINSYYEGHVFGIYSSREKAKKVLENIMFYLKQNIPNYIYKMPQDDEVDDLKKEAINDNKDIIKVKFILHDNIYIRECLEQEINNFEQKVNNFLLNDNINIIDIKYDVSQSKTYSALIIYKENIEDKKIIKKEKDILAVEINNSERKIYNIKDES